MAETNNSEAPIASPHASHFGERAEGKLGRRERSAAAQQSGPGRLTQFIRDVRAEMKRVSWPSATEVKNTTIITLIAVIFFAVYLFAVDQALSRLIIGIDWLIEKVVKFLGVA
ncbi:MAG: preprotein translocase subunit SecE [Actinobacteria bacterium]|nr:preprotein translocase subunit SecE [Actinomycetota bacterium]